MHTPAISGPVGRLHVITDTRAGRDPLPDVRAALSAGAPVIQVRVSDGCGDREAYEAKLVLVRPDQYVVWAGNDVPGNASSIVRTAVGTV